MRVLVVDDEAPARRRLIALLAELGGVEVVGEADNAQGALEAAGRTGPDLLFLDIAMPGMDGLQLAARYTDLPPVIFVTAHEEHALRAFDVDAIDYLLKPVSLERLAAALARARERRRPAEESFRGLPVGPRTGAARVVTQQGNTIRLFEATAISRFWSSDKYTLFVADGQEQVTRESLSTLARRLRPHHFRRVHRGELVRLDAIRSLSSGAGVHQAHLDDGQVVPVSRRLVAALKRELARSVRGTAPRR